MSDEILKKEDLFDVIKNGTAWFDKKIKEELEKVVSSDHSMRWDSDDEYHYIYDNECYLFILKGKIEVRCDRENVFSSYKTAEFPITNIDDIQMAYECFRSMTMEDEEE